MRALDRLLVTTYRLVIHAGYPKAASTAIQDTLMGSRGLLRGKGILYPQGLISPGGSKHEELFRLVRLNKVGKLLKLLKEELDRNENIHTVFLSSESIINQLYNVDDARWEELFRGLKVLGSVEILIIHRDAGSFLTSYYKQAVINQPSPLIEFYGTALTISEFAELPAVTRLLDLEGVVAKLRRLSGARVRIFNYWSDVVEEVANWLAHEDLRIGTPERSNESLRPEEVELVRQLNATGPTPEQRNAWLRILSHCCPLGSRTALMLSSRARKDDMMGLDGGWLFHILPGRNPGLDVDDQKLLSLAQKSHQWLCKYQGVNMRDRPLE